MDLMEIPLNVVRLLRFLCAKHVRAEMKRVEGASGGSEWRERAEETNEGSNSPSATLT